MEIESLPNSYDELIRILTKEGSMSFIIDQKHNKRFRICIQRLNKLESLFRKKRNIINSFTASFYGMYVGLLQILLTAHSKSLENAITTYQVAWKYIASIEGENLPNEKARITYIGRT